MKLTAIGSIVIGSATVRSSHGSWEGGKNWRCCSVGQAVSSFICVCRFVVFFCRFFVCWSFSYAFFSISRVGFKKSYRSVLVVLCSVV